jgi:hypothetical protein
MYFGFNNQFIDEFMRTWPNISITHKILIHEN